jgi:CDP-diacylglycerol--glycerol-3-phosphate 3-phosphatidyltransferase
MNTPNKLTLLRMALVPVYVGLMYLPHPNALLIADAVFVVAALTDALDGHIARRDGLVTDFGKLMDPLADKVLVMAAMVMLVYAGYAPAWAVVVILAREFLVSLMRQVAAARGHVLAADNLGKIKTVSQMTWLIITMLYRWADRSLSYSIDWLGPVSAGLGLVTVALTLASGIRYVSQNRSLFSLEQGTG